VRYRLASGLAALALAGCGGDGTTGASAASIVPAGALAFVEMQVDLDSDQWRQVQELLNRFPDRPQLLELLNEQLREEGLEYERDVAPALGETVALVWAGDADADDVVMLVQPEDDERFEALVEKLREESSDEFVTGEIDGWRAASERQESIDALRDAGASLADDDAFEAALAEAPDERLAFGFVRGELAEEFGTYANAVEFEWAAGSLEARDNGGAAAFTISGGMAFTGEAYTSERVGEAPGDALAFLSFNGEALRSQASTLAPFAQMLGIRIDELLEGVNGEGALWVRPGTPIPEVTLVVESDDAEGARAALEPLLRSLPLEVRVGVVDGRVVVTTAASPEDAVRTTGETLGESEDFADAVEAAGMPDETSGFLYLNVADALPLLGLAGLAGADVPEELLENLRPIRSVVAWSEGGDTSTQTLFVEIQ
jgi:hypothetical protein